MKKTVNFSRRMLVCGITSLLFVASCVNGEYDLNREIDTEINVLPGLTVPVGSVSKVAVSDLFGLSDDITTDTDGNLKLQITGEETFTIGSGELLSFESYIPEDQMFEPVVMNFPLSLVNLPGGAFQGMSFSYSELTGSPLSTSTSMNFEADLPEEIVDVRSVSFFEDVSLNLESDARVWLKSGFRITFPEYVVIQNYLEYPEYQVEDKHTIVLLQDVPSPSELNFYFNRIYVPEGAFADGKLRLNLEVGFEGDMYVNADDLAGLTGDIEVTAAMKGFVCRPATAELKVNYVAENEDTDLEIEDLPAFLAENKASIGIYDPTLYLTIHNWMDMSFGLQTDITSYMSSSSATVSLGKDKMIDVAAASDLTLAISSHELDVEEGAVNIVDPAVRDMFREIPDRVSVHDMLIRYSEDYFDYQLGVNGYRVGYEYRLDLPLAFSENAALRYVFDVDTDDVDYDAVADSLVLDMDLVNSIPMSFDFTVMALDSEAYPVDGLEFSSDSRIASGTPESPVVTPVTLTLTPRKGSVRFNALRFTVTASAPSPEHVGVPLNINQGIELRNISLSLPDGITINTENL